MSGSMFNLYLHQNYVDFFSDIDDVVKASEYLSTADVLCGNWSVSVISLLVFKYFDIEPLDFSLHSVNFAVNLRCE